MKAKRYAEEQIAFALRQAESGVPAVEVCREMGVSEKTLYAWKKKYGGMGISELRRLRQLEGEQQTQAAGGRSELRLSDVAGRALNKVLTSAKKRDLAVQLQLEDETPLEREDPLCEAAQR